MTTKCDENTNSDETTEIIYHTSNIIYGTHLGVYKSLYDTAWYLLNSPYRIVQIYIDNSRGYTSRKFTPAYSQDLLNTRRLVMDYKLRLVIHTSLMNQITSMTDGVTWKTREKLMRELDVGVVIGAPGIVHFGSNSDHEKGIRETIETIEIVLSKYNSDTKFLADLIGISVQEFVRRRVLILENSAGEGKKMGSTLEDIAEVLGGVDLKYLPQLGVCIDTAHLFGRGEYDLGLTKDVDRFFFDFDKKVGARHLKYIHLNDSRVCCGSHKDRHELMGHGLQFGVSDDGENERRNGFKGLVKFCREAGKRGVPLIGEPPGKDADGNVIKNVHQKELTLLNRLLKLYFTK